MRAFVSGQIGEKETVRDAFSALESIGLEITHDWTRTDDLLDKVANPDECGLRAANDIAGVVDSDIYVLLSDNRAVGKGMYAELGAALALQQTLGKPEIYVVGPMNHLSIFYLHPAVHRLNTVQELINLLASEREDLAHYKGELTSSR
jgi:hypothetical protein